MKQEPPVVPAVDDGWYTILEGAGLDGHPDADGEAGEVIEERVHIGGLLRCCLASLADYLQQAEQPSQEGQTLDCKYEAEGNQKLVFRDGYWRWNEPA